MVVAELWLGLGDDDASDEDRKSSAKWSLVMVSVLLSTGLILAFLLNHELQRSRAEKEYHQVLLVSQVTEKM